MNNMNTKHIKGMTERQEKTSAHVALREALANCLIHCNYAQQGNILVVGRRDMISMRNPGCMLIPVDDFYAGGRSVCRNPLLQKLFMFLGNGEKAGSGADIIEKGWEDNGWTRPSLSEKIQPEETLMTLFIEDKKNALSEKDQSTQKNVEKIRRAMEENPHITIKELTVLVGLSRRGVEENIRKLQANGVIRRVGPDKGGHWEIINE